MLFTDAVEVAADLGQALGDGGLASLVLDFEFKDDSLFALVAVFAIGPDEQ